MKLLAQVLFISLSALSLTSFSEVNSHLVLDSIWDYDEISCKSGFNKKDFFLIQEDEKIFESDVYLSLKAPSPNSKWLLGEVSWSKEVDYSLPFYVRKITITSYAEGSSEILYQKDFLNHLELFAGQKHKFEIKVPISKPAGIEVRVWGGFN